MIVGFIPAAAPAPQPASPADAPGAPGISPRQVDAFDAALAETLALVEQTAGPAASSALTPVTTAASMPRYVHAPTGGVSSLARGASAGVPTEVVTAGDLLPSNDLALGADLVSVLGSARSTSADDVALEPSTVGRDNDSEAAIVDLVVAVPAIPSPVNPKPASTPEVGITPSPEYPSSAATPLPAAITAPASTAVSPAAAQPNSAAAAAASPAAAGTEPSAAAEVPFGNPEMSAEGTLPPAARQNGREARVAPPGGPDVASANAKIVASPPDKVADAASPSGAAAPGATVPASVMSMPRSAAVVGDSGEHVISPRFGVQTTPVTSGAGDQGGGEGQTSGGQGRPSPEFTRFAAAMTAAAPHGSVDDGTRLAAAVAVPAVGPAPAASAAISATAPAAPVAPAPPDTTAAENISRLVHAIRINARPGGWEATVRLKPEQLGDVTIALRMQGNIVSAVVSAETAGVRQWLESQEQAVRSGMAEHGLQLERFVVQRDGHRRDPQTPDGEPRRQPRRQPETTQHFEVIA